MPGDLRSNEVASLNPYVNAKDNPQIASANELLEQSASQPPEVEFDPNALIQREKDEWKRVLGAEVKVKPLPDTITEEVVKKLEDKGFGLRYIPELNFMKYSYLQGHGEQEYLDALCSSYPNWTANVPEDWFWKMVKDRKIDFPFLEGMWVGIETMPKPKSGEDYKGKSFVDKLIVNRFNQSWASIYTILEEEKERNLQDIGLSTSIHASNPAHIRFPDAIEWNLLGLREGWNDEQRLELTDSSYLGNDKERIGEDKPPFILVAGGGLTTTFVQSADEGAGDVGFRLMVVFEQEKTPPKSEAAIYFASPSGAIPLANAFIMGRHSIKGALSNRKRDHRFESIRKKQNT